MAIPTKQQIANASLDTNTIETVLNGSGEVISRLGTVLKTVRLIVAELASISEGGTRAATVNTRIKNIENVVIQVDSLILLILMNQKPDMLTLDGDALTLDGDILTI